MAPSDSSKQPQQTNRSLAEWITFYLSLAIFGLIIGLILYTWVEGSDRPPILSVNLTEQIQKLEGQFYQPYTVKNTGDKTAESVEVIAELSWGDNIKETGTQQIDFLSGGESSSGAFVFSHNPQQGTLVTRIGSYKLPYILIKVRS